MTLVETLVTFVILGLLGTLLLQAVSFFAARYDNVQRVHRVAALSSLGQNWFASSVRGLVPYGVEARRFAGNATSFEGITLEPLNADPGTPVTARWSIDAEGVSFTEADISVASGAAERDVASGAAQRNVAVAGDVVQWRVLVGDRAQPPEGGLFFEYADREGNWHDRWPLPEPDEDPGAAVSSALASIVTVAPGWTPNLIRLVSAAGDTLWLARVEPSTTPVLIEDNYR